ncbi:MAG: aminoacyl-histidine dipeptidase [Lachnospiraceae bacterium]|nr:aminoacyl-histidine dipeptidase [Lachnospiraceae bacterium]MDD7668581.1 aminoacyl-histidine dipeptidase [Lachnospiraceae bacterium]MDY2620615.1 aminoacyl-histidine dipeptidase [Agathobacter sp.]
MMKLENLYPERVFYYFEKLTEIPHGSRNTKQISDYLVSFAKEHGLKYYQDESNNVIIVKEATAGYENADTIIIQGHMDMVCEKENGCNIDFTKDSLDIFIDGDFVKAKGTTLGGDDGIAVAYALAILESKEIAHPKLEVIITVDEEIGMLGAADIDLSMITGHKMLNIDSEEEGHFLTGCAGGMSLHSNIPVQRTLQKGQKFNLKITGLEGGHSGAEIDKEHGNANVIMGRVLKGIFDRTPFGIISLAGGLKDNAIPRECISDILVPAENVGAVKEYVNEMDGILKNEFMSSDPAVTVVLTEEGEAEEQMLDFGSVNRVIFYLRTVPNGIQNMSQVMHGLVETSLNLGIMELFEDHLHTVSSVRSSVGTRKTELCERVDTVVEMVGGETEIEGAYPAWEYRKDSELRMQIAKVYEELYHTEPVFETIHAGLECGLLSQKIKDLDCVAFGPDIFDIHTPKERLSISSTARVWDMLVAFLKEAK